jgi:hypothetical protein
LLTQSECFDDEGEVNKGDEDEIKLIEPREDAAKSLECSEQSFNLVALSVHGTVIPPKANLLSP